MDARLYEDNAGFLHFCLEVGRSISIGNDPSPGMLVQDLFSLKNWIDDYISDDPDWANIMPYHGDGDGAKIIAQMVGGTITLYIDRMASASRQYLFG